MHGSEPDFGDYLKRLRQAVGLSRQELAKKLTLSESTIAKWEQDETRPRPRDYDTVVQLCDALGLAQLSERRAKLFWLAGKWIERVERLDGLPAPRCRKLWGRTELLDEVIGKLQDPAAPRIVLLSAYGGYGKTELARYIAEKLVEAHVFLDAAWVSLKQEEFHFTLGKVSPVPLAFEPSRATIVRRLMHRFACRSEGELQTRLGTEALLLVIDNLETLPMGEREAVVSDVHRVIGTGPSRAIFTSRFDVTVPYVYKPPVAGLSLAASDALLRDEAHYFSGAAELRTAGPEAIRQIWELTAGAPLALHLVVGQSQRYELRQVLVNLREARAHGRCDDFYQFLHEQAWRELGIAAQTLLVFMSTATRAPQTSLQLLGVSASAEVTFDEQTLHEALGELTRWFLVERTEPGEMDRARAYGLHPLTRTFVLSQEMRGRWEAELHLTETSLREAATRKHQEIL